MRYIRNSAFVSHSENYVFVDDFNHFQKWDGEIRYHKIRNLYFAEVIQFFEWGTFPNKEQPFSERELLCLFNELFPLSSEYLSGQEYIKNAVLYETNYVSVPDDYDGELTICYYKEVCLFYDVECNAVFIGVAYKHYSEQDSEFRHHDVDNIELYKLTF